MDDLWLYRGNHFLSWIVVWSALHCASVRGAPSLIQTKASRHTIHCKAFELNLLLCPTLKAIPEACDFFDLLGSVCSVFSTSLVHHHKSETFKKQLRVRDTENLSCCPRLTVRARLRPNVTLQNLPALIQTLRSISTLLSKWLEGKLSHFGHCST